MLVELFIIQPHPTRHNKRSNVHYNLRSDYLQALFDKNPHNTWQIFRFVPLRMRTHRCHGVFIRRPEYEERFKPFWRSSLAAVV